MKECEAKSGGKNKLITSKEIFKLGYARQCKNTLRNSGRPSGMCVDLDGSRGEMSERVRQ